MRKEATEEFFQFIYLWKYHKKIEVLSRNFEMKKKLCILMALFIVVTMGGIGVTALSQGGKKEQKEEFTIVTSFYPMYITAANIAKNIPGVQVVNLTEIKGGCLHDYQLTTEDMKKLEGADVFVMNGGGMEGFLEEVVKAYPDLTIIDSSEGISMLTSEITHNHEEEESGQHDHEHEEETSHEHEEEEHQEHNHGEHNSHIWLSAANYEKQVKNILRGLGKKDKTNEKAYQNNGHSYLEKIEEIEIEYQQAREKLSGIEIVSFHEGFDYVADQLGLKIIKMMDLDENSGLSAGEMAGVIDEMKYHNIKNVLVEQAYASFIKDGIGKETQAQVLTIDPLVEGKSNLDSYIDGMRKNLKVLLQMEKEH